MNSFSANSSSSIPSLICASKGQKQNTINTANTRSQKEKES